VWCYLQVWFWRVVSNIISREEILITFQTRIFPELPSELMFAQSVLKNIQLGCLVYGITTIKGHVTCITNEVLSLKQSCVFEVYFCDYESPVELANCTAYIRYCPLHTDDSCFRQVLHFTKNPRQMSKYISAVVDCV